MPSALYLLIGAVLVVVVLAEFAGSLWDLLWEYIR
jgi:hypothetical protein